ncbi:hypothetical protein LTR78_002734 [Recurvomyces mirabilis]|uniref:Uncharacterized protein n=1 Tax=Recurvomyces mirabilis TaxID=574656 RepID=A0AAE1C3X1_9PEZI|nr:hypothetical protein LTR78_002734 [Recurvomyces mirabilis]KAK5159531.1 hypothetical protein LTS14_002673 [Recurvomyces mirabilis]
MHRLPGALLLFGLLLVVAIHAEKDDRLETEQIPTIFQDPLQHLGFAWKDISSWTDKAAKDVKHELDKVDPGDAGKLVHQAGHDIGSWTQQAVKDIKAETDKIDLTVPNEWIRGAAADVKKAIGNLDESALQEWLKQASKEVGLDGTLDDLQAVKLEELPAEAWNFIEENPGQTAFYIVEGIVFIAPGAVNGPLLNVVGFGAHGVRAEDVWWARASWKLVCSSHERADGRTWGSSREWRDSSCGAIAGAFKVVSEQIKPGHFPGEEEREEEKVKTEL